MTHKNTWISSVEVRNLRAEILISKVHKLAIEQQIATYQIKANTSTWYRESRLHMAYGGTIGTVILCVVVLMCLVCYCNHKIKKNASGVVINQVTMDETPARKMSVQRKVLFTKENTRTEKDTAMVTIERKESTTSLAFELGRATPTAPPLEKCTLPEPEETMKLDDDAEALPLMDKTTAQRLAESKLRALKNPMMQ